MKALCDAGILISLSSSSLMDIVSFLSDHNLEFIISPGVKDEVITKPINDELKEYYLSAVRIKKCIKDGDIDIAEFDLDTEEIMRYANNMFYVRGEPLKLIHKGESELLVLAQKLGLEHLLVDERTTRLLIEGPNLLRKHLEDEFGVNVMVEESSFRELTSRISFLRPVRSSELIFLAYEKGYFQSFGEFEEEALEAALYRVKYSGCSISFDEIEQLINSK